MNFFWNIILVIGCFFAISCAQQSSPKGGKRDVTPPQIESSDPANFSINYNRNVIELKFDEFVQISQLSSQIMITPSMKNKPEIKLSGKKLLIILKDTLARNTTYLVNFAEGIKDITEGNPLDSNIFVFSTGSFIDSSIVKGRLRDAYSRAPVEKMKVFLYHSFEDSVPFIERPNYLTTSDESGNFEFRYLKNRAYKIVAVQDEDADYMFDPSTEMVGFIAATITPNDTISLEMNVFLEKFSNQYISDYSSPEYGKIELILNESAKKPNVKLLQNQFKKAWYIEDFNATNDTLVYWLTATIDTLNLVVLDGESSIDTLHLVMAEKPKKKVLEKKRLSIKTNINTRIINLFDSLIITFDSPILEYETNKMILIENTDTFPVNLQFNDPTKRTFILTHKWKESSNYKLFIPDSQVVNLYGITNDTLQIEFLTETWNTYATIKLKHDFPKESSQYLVHLINSNGTEITTDTVGNKGFLAYKNLKEGKYQLKLIYDNNKNGKWDTGNLLQHQQPEKVIYYSEPIEMRSGWDMDLEWVVE